MGKGCGCGVSKSVRVPSASAPPLPQDDDDEAYRHLYVSWTNDEGPSLERPLSRPQSAPVAMPNGTASTSGVVQLSFVLDFVANKLPLGDTNIPTWSVAYNIIQPATAELEAPYISLPDVQHCMQPYDSQRPYYFVSHAWSRPLRETSAMLAHHFRGRDPRDVYLWMDIFAIRQRAFTAASQELDMAAVDAALKNSSGVLLCLDEAGAALRRTWCLYEAWVGATWQSRPSTAAGAAIAAAAASGSAASAAAAGEGDAPGGLRGRASDGVGGNSPVAPIGVVALTSRALLPEERARLFSKIDIRQSRSKYRADREALLAAARSAAGSGGLDRVNHTLRVALSLQPLVPDMRADLHPGRVTQVPELWDMSRVDAWLALPESSKSFSALSIYGPACSGKSIAAATVAGHLASQGIPVAAHFCNVSDVRTLDPIGLLVSLALQLARAPRIGPRLLRQYGELSAGLVADLMSYNNSPAALEAAMEALLVQPLQHLLQSDGGAPKAARDGDAAQGATGDGAAKAVARPSAAAAAAAAAVGRGWVDNGDLRDRGGGCDPDASEEDEEEAFQEEGGGRSLAGAAGARSMRAQSMRFAPPKVAVIIIDGIDQADGSIVGGAAPYDNQVLQLIEEHLLKLPSYVRLIFTSRSLSYIVPRLTDRLTPLELTPDALRPLSAFMRNIRFAIAAIDPSLSRRQRAATAASLVTKSRGSLLYIKLALCCMELEREMMAAETAGAAGAGDQRRLRSSQSSRKRGGAGDAGGDDPTAAEGGGAGGEGALQVPPQNVSRSTSQKPANISELPNTLGGLIERYLAIKLCRLDSIQKRNRVASVLAVLATAREPLTAMQLAAAVGGGARTGGAATAAAGEVAADAPPALLSPPTLAQEGLLQDVVAAALGVLVRLRGQPGHHTQEVMLLHSAIAEWLQQSSPRILLAGSVVVDSAGGHRSLASHCRDDALACLRNGRLTPYGYSVRHIFLHAGLAALAATANADAGGPASPMSNATGRSSRAPLRSRGSTTSAANASAVALATALAAAAASADWSATLELLLQRLDLWTSIYTAGAGSAARWVIMALASLPACAIPSADPASSDSPLFALLAEARRWLALYHGSLCWFPLSLVSSVATLPEDSELRSRALEFSAGPDPWELTGAGGPTVTTITASNAASPASIPLAPPTPPQQLQLPPRSGSPSRTNRTPRRGPTAEGGPKTEPEPQEEQHLLLLSTGDRWSCCVQTLRTNVGRVLQVAMHPGGRLLATVHDEERGVFLWDIWGAKPLLTMARCYEMGRNPTAAFFTPDGRKLICAARSIFVWEVCTGRLLMELYKAPPRKAASGSRGFRRGSGGGTAAAEAGSDPDGPVVALAMSPGGGRVAAGHGNGVTRIWDMATGKLLAALAVSHHRPVTALAFSRPAGATLVVAHGEGADAAPKAGAPVRDEEIGDVPTQLIKADELLIHVWKVSGSSPKELEVLKGHTGRVNSLVFSTLDGNMVTGSADETMRIWANEPKGPQTGKTPRSDFRQVFILGGVGQGVVHTMQFSAAPPPLQRGGGPFSNSHKFAADGDADGVAAGTVDFTAASVANLTAAAFAANAGMSDDAGGDGAAVAQSARGSATGITSTDAVAASAPSALDSRADLPVMAYSCGSGIIRLWSPGSQRQVGLLRGLEGPVTSLSFSGDGRLLASADRSDTGIVRVWDVGGACARDPLDSSPATGVGGLQLRHPVELMSLSPDGSRLAIVCADLNRENIRVIDVFTGRRLAVMGPGGAGGHEGKINAVAWSWDSSRLATGSDDLSVRVWYVGSPTAPPGNPLAAAAAIVAAELASRELTTPPASSSTSGDGAGGDTAAAAAAGSRGSGSGSRSGQAAADVEPAGGLAATRPGWCQLVLVGHHRKVQCVAWAHSGKKLASGGYDQMVRIWDSASGEQLTLIYQVSWVSALAFSPDDARLVTGAGGKAVYMFNSTTGKNLAGHAGQLVEGSPSAAGTAAAAAAAAGGPEGNASDDSWMSALRFNPDGTLLASRDMHSNVTLWDVSGMRLRPLRVLDGSFREALFCPSTGDLQLYELTASGALVIHAIPAGSLPLGRTVQRSVTLSHPLLEFRGLATDAAVNHNAAVLLTADNRAFFFVSGSHLSVVRQEASRAERVGTAGGGEVGWFSTSAADGSKSTAVSRVASVRE